MKTNVQGKTAVITGAGSGIGKAIALKLAECGLNIVLLGGRNEDKLANLKKEIEEKSAKCIYIKGDLTDSSLFDTGINEAVMTFGGIDILINNAGSAMNAKFEDVTEELFDDIMNLDVKVPYFLTQKMLPELRKSDYAMVINIASVVAHSGYPNQSVYAAAKHALLGFSKSLANEVYKDNIRVHVVSPGAVFTDMVKLSRPDLTGDNMIVPDDIADIVEYLITHRTYAVIDEINVHRVNKEPFLV